MSVKTLARPFTDADLEARILHAESYPFARPACSYLFENGRMQPLLPAIEGRIAVIASGSNAAPERLRAKFGEAQAIPVTRAVLTGFAVVFAGHFTRYGAIPATLAPCAGAVTEVWVTWLTTDQLQIMHRSEGVIACREAVKRYDYIEIDGLDLRADLGYGRPAHRIERAGAYFSRRMLAPEGHPIRFAEIACRDARLRSLSHRAALRMAHARLAASLAFADFMAAVLSAPERRQALFEELTPSTIGRSADLGSGAPFLPRRIG